MARATLALVQAALMAGNPPGVTDDAITNLCTRVDHKLDSMTAPDTISTTSNMAKELAVDMVLLEIEYGLWLLAGGALSGKPKPVMVPSNLLDRIVRLSAENYGIGVADIMED